MLTVRAYEIFDIALIVPDKMAAMTSELTRRDTPQCLRLTFDLALMLRDANSRRFFKIRGCEYFVKEIVL